MPFDLATIGQLLKTAREEKGFQIDEVSRTLFIRKAIIRAIESGEWSNLPHPVYVKGYINQYASYLRIVDSVEAALHPQPETLPDVKETAPRGPEDKTARRWEPARWTLQKKISAVASMAAIVIAFVVFQNIERNPRYVPERVAVPAVNQTVSNVSNSSNSNVYQPVAATDAVQGEKRVFEMKKLMIACQERTWVRILIDDEEKKEFMMNPEEVVVLNAKDRFDLLVGNAGGVKLFYNGKDVGFTGETGEVKRVNLS